MIENEQVVSDRDKGSDTTAYFDRVLKQYGTEADDKTLSVPAFNQRVEQFAIEREKAARTNQERRAAKYPGLNIQFNHDYKLDNIIAFNQDVETGKKPSQKFEKWRTEIELRFLGVQSPQQLINACINIPYFPFHESRLDKRTDQFLMDKIDYGGISDFVTQLKKTLR